MYVSITGNKGNQDVYIKQSYRKDNGKTSSRIYKKLGKYNDLLAQFSGDETAMMDWAKKEAKKETLLYNQRKERITVSFSPLARIPLDEERLFNVGYLFLQQLCTELRLDNICRNIRNHHRFTYDFHAILTDLIYARILSPSSKLFLLLPVLTGTAKVFLAESLSFPFCSRRGIRLHSGGALPKLQLCLSS